MQYPNYPTNYSQLYPYQQPMMNQPMNQPQQIQNSGCVEVNGYQEVVNYPVACATSVNLIDMQAKKFYVKTRGFSSFDQPVIESYTLVKDEDKKAESSVSYATPDDIKALQADIDSVKADINKLMERGTANE